jgi:dCMP deaminase
MKSSCGWSKETGRKVGAVIVGPDNEIRATGFNGFPRGVNDDAAERHSRETGEKYVWSVHAEVNAICNAARIGVPLKGCRMYLPLYPCAGCAKAVIQSGIEEIITSPPDFNDPKWSKEFRDAQTMFAEAGLRVHFMEISSSS